MPCDQPSTWTMLIGPSAALAGVIIGLLFSSMEKKKEREHQRTVLLRNKYEEIVLALGESVSHVQALQTVETTLDLLLLSRPVLAQKFDILARLYFPELRSISDDYLHSVVALQNSLAENYDPSSSLKVCEQGAKSKKVEEAKNNLMDIKHAFDEAIDLHANKYA